MLAPNEQHINLMESLHCLIKKTSIRSCFIVLFGLEWSTHVLSVKLYLLLQLANDYLIGHSVPMKIDNPVVKYASYHLVYGLTNSLEDDSKQLSLIFS